MTKTKPISADQLNSLFESFEFLSFDIVSNFDFRASNLLACIFNGKANDSDLAPMTRFLKATPIFEKSQKKSPCAGARGMGLYVVARK